MNHLLTFTVSYEKKVCTGAHGCHPVSSKFDIFHINLGPHSFDLFGSQETKKKICCLFQEQWVRRSQNSI